MKKHATLLGAGVPRCNDVPDSFRVLFHEKPREGGPHGSTGCAEGFQSAGHAAILNGIAQAAGVRICTLPAAPAKVKAALQAKAAGEASPPAVWDLGCALRMGLEHLQRESSA